MKSKLWQRLLRRFRQPKTDSRPPEPAAPDFAELDYAGRLALLRQYFADCDDAVFSALPSGSSEPACLFYLDTVTDGKMIDNRIVQPLLEASGRESAFSLRRLLSSLPRTGILAANFQPKTTLAATVDAVLTGHAVLLAEGVRAVYAVATPRRTMRSPMPPETEPSVRGRKTGFVEDRLTNIELIRDIIKSSRLKVRRLSLGEYTRTRISLLYLGDLAPLDVLADLMQKLRAIKIDGVLASSNIVELIEPAPYSPFPQILVTERLDRVTGCLLEGRIALIVSGDPNVLVLPITFPLLMHVPDDYYFRPAAVAGIRLFRYASLFLATTGTALYVAVNNFHYEIVPFRLLISFAESVAAIPFPAIVEALLLELAAEILRESSIHLPGPSGPMIGILGAVLMGQAAITAGLVSPILVIFVALSIVSSFVIPSQELSSAARVIKFPMIVAAGFL
jgi:hypothetical protein